jgi:hypothetical protein
MIWGGVGREETQDLISLYLKEFLRRLLMFSEANMRAFLFMRGLI